MTSSSSPVSPQRPPSSGSLAPLAERHEAQVDLERLDTTLPLEAPLYHPSGILVFEAKEIPLLGDLIALQRLRVRHLYAFTDARQAQDFFAEAGVQRISMSKVLPTQPLAADLYGEEAKLLVRAGMMLNPQLREELSARGVTTVPVARVFGELEELKRFVAEKRRLHRRRSEEDRPVVLAPDRLLQRPEALTPQALQGARVDQRQAMTPKSAPLHQHINHQAPTSRPDEIKNFYLQLYEQHFERARRFFDELREGTGTITALGIGRLANDIIQCLIRDKNLLICLHQLRSKNDPHVNHALNVTLTAINVAAACGLDREQIFEIAFAAFLHDVALPRAAEDPIEDPLANVPADAAQRRHPEESLALLRRIEQLPALVPLLVYHHHERCDGSGYPQGLKREAIHPFAQILGIADTYDALISPKPDSSARLPYAAMEDLIRASSRGLFDRDMMKGFLCYFSLFPVGSWVRLSTREVAHVVASHPVQYDRPAVRVVFKNESREVYASPRLLDLSVHRDVHVTAAVDTPRDLYESQFWLLNLL